jgi:hypothetical protein
VANGMTTDAPHYYFMQFLSFGALEAWQINGEEPLGSILKYMQSDCNVKYYSYELPAMKDICWEPKSGDV